MTSRLGDYLLFETLGTGAFGKVRRAVHQPTDRQYAIKIMDKTLIRNQELTINVRREIAIMRAFNHANIVSVHNVLTSKTKLYVVLDLVRGPELFEVIAKRGAGGLPEKEARKYFQHLIDGVDYCHRRGVCHRDLKPENLLIDQDGTLRITDFGMSSMKGAKTTTDLLTTQCGTPNYIAPEIISGTNPRYDGQKVDAWACGIILFALLAGYLPFDETDLAHLFEVIQKGHFEFPSWFSAGAKDLIWRLLCVDPNTRASVHDVKQHPWFLVNYQPSQSARVNAVTKRRRRRRGHASKSLDEMGIEKLPIQNNAHPNGMPNPSTGKTKTTQAPPTLSLDIPSLQIPSLQVQFAPQASGLSPSQTAVAAAETARIEMLRSRRAMSFSKKYSLLRKGIVTYGGLQVNSGSFCGSVTLGGEQQARLRGVLSTCNSSLSASRVEVPSVSHTDKPNQEEPSQPQRKGTHHDSNALEQQNTIQAIQSLRGVISNNRSILRAATEIDSDCHAEEDRIRRSTLKALRKLRDDLRVLEPSSSPLAADQFLVRNTQYVSVMSPTQRKDTIRLLDVWESRIVNDLHNDEESEETKMTEQEICAFQSLLQTWETHLGGEDFIEDVLIPGSEAVDDEYPAEAVPENLYERCDILRHADVQGTRNRKIRMDRKDSGLDKTTSSAIPVPAVCPESSSSALLRIPSQKAQRNNHVSKSDNSVSDDGSDLAKLWNHVLVANTSRVDTPEVGALSGYRQDIAPSQDLMEDHMSSPVTECERSPSSTRDGAQDLTPIRKGKREATEGFRVSKLNDPKSKKPHRPRSSSKAPETSNGNLRLFPGSELLDSMGDRSQVLTSVQSHDFVVEPPLVRSHAQRKIRVDSTSSRPDTGKVTSRITGKVHQGEKESRSGSLRAKSDHLKLNDLNACHVESLFGVARRYNFLSIRSKYSAQFESGLDPKVCLRELGRLMETEGIDVSRKHGQKSLRIRIPGPRGKHGVAASFDFHAKGETGSVVHIKRVGGDRAISRNEAEAVLSNFVRRILRRFSDFEPGFAVLPGRTYAISR